MKSYQAWFVLGLATALTGGKAVAETETAVLSSPAEGAAVADLQVGLGPFVGGGTMSTGARVRHTSGYQVLLQRSFPLGYGFALGPRLEVSNALVNARADADGLTRISTYDNRIFAAGLRLSHPVGNAGTLAQEAYLAAVAGRGFSKLAVDESADENFRQSLYSGITGNYFGGELGALLPVRGNFGIELALMSSVYAAEQAGIGGTWKSDGVNPDGSYGLTEGTYDADDSGLTRRVVMRTVAVKVGLALGF